MYTKLYISLFKENKMWLNSNGKFIYIMKFKFNYKYIYIYNSYVWNCEFSKAYMTQYNNNNNNN